MISSLAQVAVVTDAVCVDAGVPLEAPTQSFGKCERRENAAGTRLADNEVMYGIDGRCVGEGINGACFPYSQGSIFAVLQIRHTR